MKTLNQLLDETGVPEFAEKNGKVYRAFDLCSYQNSQGHVIWHAGRDSLVTDTTGDISGGLWFSFEKLQPPNINGWELAEPLPRKMKSTDYWVAIGGIELRVGHDHGHDTAVWIMKRSCGA